jgi:hypothetical protein
MSIFKKRRGNRSYVYFQLYGGPRRKVEYLGLEDQLSTWEKAEKLFLEYLDKRLADFYSQIPAELRNRIRPKEERYRTLEAVTPQIGQESEIPAIIGIRSRPFKGLKKRKKGSKGK